MRKRVVLFSDLEGFPNVLDDVQNYKVTCEDSKSIILYMVIIRFLRRTKGARCRMNSGIAIDMTV